MERQSHRTPHTIPHMTPKVIFTVPCLPVQGIVSSSWYAVEDSNPYIEIRSLVSYSIERTAHLLTGRGTQNRTETTCSQGMDATRYTIPRLELVARVGVEPTSPAFQTGAKTALATRPLTNLVERIGIEPICIPHCKCGEHAQHSHAPGRPAGLEPA